jgi:hypothetical protein
MAGTESYSLNQYAAEVMAGLKNEKAHLDCAVENQCFYDLDAEQYIPQREAESYFDYKGRSKRESGLVREVVDILCEHLYSPGPARAFDVPAGQEFLERVWADNLFDALMQKADCLATLNDVCAVQVDAGDGDFEEKPITLHLWGKEEFVAWTNPTNAKEVVAVCTIDRFDQTTTYRLWDATEVRVYRTEKGDGTSGGQVAQYVAAESAPHDYKVLPFFFVHYELPVRRFVTPGLGTFVRKAEVNFNDRLSRLDESIHKHLNPVGLAKNLPPDWNPVLEPQRFVRLYGAGPQMGMNGYEAGGDPSLSYLQATIDVAGAWDDSMRHVNQVFESCRVPLTAVRMEQSGVASGFALLVEQAPLLTRARKRRQPFGVFEAAGARVMLLCAGNHYGKTELVEAAKKGRLALGWPEPSIPVPTPDQNQIDAGDIAMGIKSRTMVVMQRKGCDRQQALQLLEQVKKDREEEQRIDPMFGPVAQPDQDQAEEGQDPAADDETQDDEADE